MTHVIVSFSSPSDSFLAHVTHCPRNFIIKGNASNGKIPPSFFFSAVTPFSDIAFVIEEATGCINEEPIGAISEAARGAIVAPRNLPFFLFHVLLFHSHYQVIDLIFLVTL